MDINGYEFVMYDPIVLEHIARHLEGSGVVGSVFLRDVFPSVKDILDYILLFVRECDYKGERHVIERDAPFIIGLDTVVSLADLPENCKVSQELRDGKNLVNVMQGISPIQTRSITAVIGPYYDHTKVSPVSIGKHGFYEVYPGRYYPPIEDRKFWSKHGFIKI